MRKLIIVKFGSESLIGSVGINEERIHDHARRLALLYKEYDLLIVTSGAVAWGRHRLEKSGKTVGKYSKRTQAMLGSAGIVTAWEAAFSAVGLIAGQVLASHHEIRDDSLEARNFVEAYETARREYTIPILNHNDFLALSHSKDDELDKIDKQKDNDEYSFEVARLLKAYGLILATNVEGFMVDGNVQHIIQVKSIPSLKKHVYGASDKGTGGMGSKLDIAARAGEINIRAFICQADVDFTQILSGAEIGTEVVLI